MKLMVTGAGGMTGAELVRQARALGHECVGFSHGELDIADAQATESLVARQAPDVLINAAAYTAVDAAQSDPAGACRVNALGARNAARAASTNDAAFIHISTDYVFDGSATRPYAPQDEVRPINVYGETKLAGEIAVRAECSRHVIVRTSWVYSHEGRNFVRTMLRSAETRSQLNVVDDQRGSPTSAADLASALLRVASKMAGDCATSGTFHFSNSGSTTWYEFARAIFALRGLDVARIRPVASGDFATAAPRPRWSVLDTTSFETAFHVVPRPWPEPLAETIARL